MQPIENYFLIGDLHSAALVSKDGSIDWLCMPHFDSPSIFASILDKKCGHFRIKAKEFLTLASYVENSAIVEIDFSSKDFEFCLRDFMLPRTIPHSASHFLVRKLIGRKGQGKVSVQYDPKPEYGRLQNQTTCTANQIITLIGTDKLILNLPEGTTIQEDESGYMLQISLEENQTKNIVLEYEKQGVMQHRNMDYERVTRAFWESWISQGNFSSLYKNELIRSAITLKLMQYYTSGALVAAPTTSLPEALGGDRNWDYRYIWMRDATYTLYALHIVGFYEESLHFFRFVEKTAYRGETRDLHIALMYTVEGKEVPSEKILPHMSGYEQSPPVRIGNGASEQYQLDVYGSLIDSYYFMIKRGYQPSDHDKKLIIHLVERIRQRWMEKDNGIWEFRTQPEHYTHSKVMAWVGVDRVVRIADRLGLDHEYKNQLNALAKTIKDWIWTNCYDEKNHKFMQYAGATKQDATNFLFVLLQFLDKKDPRTKKIIENTRAELATDEIFVYRYKTPDGFSSEEGAFILCTFWMISALAILEEVEQAEKLFRKVQEHINPQGLLSEQIDPKTGTYLGNYPQAFSHMGYILSAYYINKYKKRSDAGKKQP